MAARDSVAQRSADGEHVKIRHVREIRLRLTDAG
jgi:hypothetical protein